MKKILFLFFILFTCSTISAQQTEPLFYQKSKKSNTLKNSTNLLKTDIISIVGGELPLIWGYKFLSGIETEVGLGALLPYYVNMYPFSFIHKSFSDKEFKFSNDKLGYSAFLALKWFPVEFRTWQNYYSQLFAHYRGYSNVNVLDFGIGSGYEWFLVDKFIINFDMNIFFLIQNSTDNETFFVDPDNSLSRLGFSFSLKLGFILN